MLSRACLVLLANLVLFKNKQNRLERVRSIQITVAMQVSVVIIVLVGLLLVLMHHVAVPYMAIPIQFNHPP